MKASPNVPPPSTPPAAKATSIDQLMSAAVAAATSATPATAPPAVQNASEEEESYEERMFRGLTFEEVLEDLNIRFLVNLPSEELTLVRMYWQAEQAHWFYEDYLRPINPTLPALSQREFSSRIIAAYPLYKYKQSEIDAVWAEYCAYKSEVPCCGGILINKQGDKCLMVRGWKNNAGWSFPRGKINNEESEVACAIREVEEETGFDLTDLINPNEFVKTQISTQEVTMFFVKDIDEATVFVTQTRKEIGAIEWVPFVDLPTWLNKKAPKQTSKKFYNVSPFIPKLKQYLSKNGINPYPPRRPAGGRELQPYSFDKPSSPSPPVVGRPSGRPSGAKTLDEMFARFVDKQIYDAAPLGSDNEQALNRLFGGPSILREEEVAGLEASQKDRARRSAEQKEDDALTRLLSGLGTASPTVAAPTLNVAPKQSKLLSVLNTRTVPDPPVSPPRSIHQSSLLSMLSPAQTPSQPVCDSTPALDTSANQPPSIPTSPLLPSISEEQDRRNRQRALLEMTVAGMSSDIPQAEAGLRSSKSSSHQTQSSIESAPQAHNPHPLHWGNQIMTPGQQIQTGRYVQHAVTSSVQPPPPYSSTPFNNRTSTPSRNGAMDDHQRNLLGTLFGPRASIGPNPGQHGGHQQNTMGNQGQGTLPAAHLLSGPSPSTGGQGMDGPSNGGLYDHESNRTTQATLPLHGIGPQHAQLAHSWNIGGEGNNNMSHRPAPAAMSQPSFIPLQQRGFHQSAPQAGFGDSQDRDPIGSSKLQGQRGFPSYGYHAPQGIPPPQNIPGQPPFQNFAPNPQDISQGILPGPLPFPNAPHPYLGYYPQANYNTHHAPSGTMQGQGQAPPPPSMPLQAALQQSAIQQSAMQQHASMQYQQSALHHQATHQPQQPQRGSLQTVSAAPTSVHQPVPRPPVGQGLLGLMGER